MRSVYWQSHTLPFGSIRVEDGPVSSPHLHMDTISYTASDASVEFNQESWKCYSVAKAEIRLLCCEFS